jgi:hypothetical protein
MHTKTAAFYLGYSAKSTNFFAIFYDFKPQRHQARIFHRLLVLSGSFVRLLRSRLYLSSPYRLIRLRANRACGLEAGQNFSLKTVCNYQTCLNTSLTCFGNKGYAADFQNTVKYAGKAQRK